MNLLTDNHVVAANFDRNVEHSVEIFSNRIGGGSKMNGNLFLYGKLTIERGIRNKHSIF